MDSRGSREVVRANKFFASGQSQLHELPRAGHQLFMGNPEGFIALVSADLLGQVTGRYEIKRFTVDYVDELGNFLSIDEEYEQYLMN